MPKVNLCPFLAQAIAAAETFAPVTPSKVDDFILLGMKIAQSRLCPEDATFGGPDPETSPEIVEAASKFADELVAACPCDDDQVDDQVDP